MLINIGYLQHYNRTLQLLFYDAESFQSFNFDLSLALWIIFQLFEKSSNSNLEGSLKCKNKYRLRSDFSLDWANTDSISFSRLQIIE